MDKRELDNLMMDIQNGDENSFSIIYKRLYKGLYSFIYSILKNHSFVEDIIQETFIKVRKHVQSYKIGTNAIAWIYQIAKNLCIDFVRKENRHANLEDEKLEYLVEEDRNWLDFQMHDFLIQTMEEQERLIVILHIVEGYKNREIAKILNIPLGTVLWKYNKAIKKLKRELEEENFEN